MKFMREIVEKIRIQAASEIEKANNLDELEKIRTSFLSRKGQIARLFDEIKNVPVDQRPEYGKLLNQLRSEVQSLFDSKFEILKAQCKSSAQLLDLSLPGHRFWVGAKHPITQTLDEIVHIFQTMGFCIATGPEIEDDYHNFSALNFPPDHPARDMQDTFFITDKILLRTHTSPVQIRVMERQKPPIRVIVPGRVYRNEAISARSYCVFHQVEGLFVDVNVSFSELKGTLIAFARRFFGSSLKYRFRPSYFPFTEPSAEMDINCFICGARGCRVCKQTGWLEILGCGMVHPNVFKSVNYDANIYTGYAFGLGIERIAMLRLGITDIRIFYENDVRMLSQFH